MRDEEKERVSQPGEHSPHFFHLHSLFFVSQTISHDVVLFRSVTKIDRETSKYSDTIG